MIACSQCGAVPDEPAAGVPLGWTVEHDRARSRHTVVCPACTRRHARAIEGKLDQAWW
jgi:Zn finger protein HypA/HybF involved in hydrogenase expression